MPSYPAKAPQIPQPRISIADTLSRTAHQSETNVFDREIERAYRSRYTSQYHTNRTRVYDLMRTLTGLKSLPENWNSYGAPVPSQIAIDRAREILDHLAAAAIAPDNVKASAEGGVALVFSGAGRNRAIVESLNDGDRYLLLYDLDGNNSTINWPSGTDTDEFVTKLRDHLRGLPLAA